jgi:hypothetical protein
MPSGELQDRARTVSTTSESSLSNRQRGEPLLSDICPGCGAPERAYCACHDQKVPLGEHPYTIRISREELEIAVHHRAATGEPLQSFVRRLIRQSAEARSLRQLMTYQNTDVPMNRPSPEVRTVGELARWGSCPGICLPPESEPNPDGETL